MDEMNNPRRKNKPKRREKDTGFTKKPEGLNRNTKRTSSETINN